MSERTHTYMPQLDGLRALAVGGVLLAHFVPPVTRYAETGTIGVKLFFVLSGFLITDILLGARDVIDGRLSPLAAQLRRFYVRRGMRLFPALALVVIIALACRFPAMQRSYPWHLTYLSNVYFARLGNWDDAVSHLWSLAVEEQFYLVWPMVILLTPRSRLAIVVASVALLGPLFRLAAMASGMNLVASMVLPPASLDPLGAGALLAIAGRPGWERVVGVHGLRRAGLAIGLPVTLVMLVLHATRHQRSWLTFTVTDSAISLLFVWVIGGAAEGFPGRWGRLLQSRVLVYLGSISYGIYLYHMFVPAINAGVLAYFGLPRPFDLWPRTPFVVQTHLNAVTAIVLNVSVTLALAAVSWVVFERPINRMRSRFDGSRRAGESRGERPAQGYRRPFRTGDAADRAAMEATSRRQPRAAECLPAIGTGPRDADPR